MNLRLLVLAPFAPRLDAHHGGGRAVASLLSRLGRRHRLALVYLRAADEQPLDEAVRAACEVVEEVVLERPGSSLLRKRAARLLKLVGAPPDRVARTRTSAYSGRVRDVALRFRPQLLQVEFAEMAQYVPAAVRDRGVPAVLVDHDPGFRAATDYSLATGGLRRLSRQLDAVAWKRYSRRAFSTVDRIVVFTDRDRDSVAHIAGRVAIEVIPLAVELPVSTLDARGEHPPMVLFFGDYLHAPNSEAALRLIRTIMPRVRLAHPEAVLELVGAHPTTAMASHAGDGVVVRGPVPSLTPYLDRAAVVVAPLRLGGGMRVKVLETLAAGKALVASSLALEGIELTSGDGVLIADADDEFADAVSALLADEDRRAALAAGARRWAVSALDWDRVAAAYEALYRDLLDGRE